MVLDDQSTGRLVLAEVIKSIDKKINIMMFSDATEAIEYARSAPLDLVLTDYKMPGMDGIETIRQLRRIYSYQQLPIVMTTVVSNREVLYRAFEAGASDYLIRPVDPTECRVRCQNLLNLRQQYVANSKHARMLEERIEEVKRDLRLREMDTLFRLAGAADRRHAVIGSQLKRMAMYSALIARAICLDEDQVEAIELAAPMHDIGKIGIPDAILQKKGRLTPEETLIMKAHPQIGYEILKDSPSRFLQAAAVIAQSHHEKYDGSGYPSGLKGREIPVEARIVALADVFDALTSERSYKPAWEWDMAVNHILEQKGLHFDPELVDVFVANIDQVRAIHRLLADG
ncbi:MAG: two-component system response regulator [Burkholderiales bacterium RIFCSPLOWO2_02_FULL_57_36]|nr:MAG: two-component system response regulator [Burkholderiales bacterium RIFCSPLOWO2_02_FULL_57_36]